MLASRGLAVVVTLIVLSRSAVGQGLYGVDMVGGEGAVLTVDPQTGATAVVVTTDAVTVSSLPVAFDPATRRLFFMGGAGALNESALYTVNLGTGSFSHVPLCCPSLQFDPQTGTLYGVDMVGGQGAVLTLDPETGATAVVVTTDAVTVSSLPVAFDPATRRLFFMGGAGALNESALYTVNLGTGSFSHVPFCCPSLQFDPQTSTLYGVDMVGGQGAVLTVDPQTGATAVVVTTDAVTVSSLPVAFDPAARRLFFMGGAGALNESALYTVNLGTGSFSHVLLCCPSLFFGAASSAAVPTLTFPVLVVLGLLLALVGIRASLGTS